MAAVPQVDFYILPDSEPAQRALFACRLIEKVYRLRHRIYVHHNDAAEARALDDLLWRHAPASFVPHAVQAEPDAADAPVHLVWDAAALPDTIAADTVLINLADTVPAFFDRFARVSEIVVQAPPILAATRAAWRYYQQRGCPLERHDLRAPRR